MIRKAIYITLIAAVAIFSGCSTKSKIRTGFVKTKRYNYEAMNNPTQFRYQPVIGTKQSDTRVMIDMGEWATIWVKNYRNENKTFIASHSITTMVREPGFITGEQIPRGRRVTNQNTHGGRSFNFRSSDLIYNHSGMGNEGIDDTQVKNYMNNYEYSKKTKRMSPQKKKESMKYDGEIKKYMKKKKEAQKKKKDRQHKESVEQRKREAAAAKRASSESSDAQYDSEDEKKNGGLK